MKSKSKLGILVLGCVLAVVVLLLAFSRNEPYSTGAVMDSVSDKYNIQSTMIGGESTDGQSTPTLWIEVYDEDDISKVENYLKEHLSQDDLEYYEIDVFPYESEEGSS